MSCQPGSGCPMRPCPPPISCPPRFICPPRSPGYVYFGPPIPLKPSWTPCCKRVGKHSKETRGRDFSHTVREWKNLEDRREGPFELIPFESFE
ncbi:hypothetical protein KPH14_009321 [Odynerus spinipes]|uniref:Uncharacterized protein n=1 Tax=Odynerus spinipes TaxID=1348599 RepID=A0AAD9RP54_9HYME|nr:hypothetical protein KPH14_009321 [Odynerus spinipes]